MTSKLISLVMLIALPFAGYAQGYFERFGQLQNNNDTAGQRKLLYEWEASGQEEAQLYVAYFNYYVKTGMREIIGIQQGDPKGKEYVLYDSTNKSVGFLDSHIEYDHATISKGLQYLDKGIAKFPDRLDMRFGKVFVLGELNDFRQYTNTIMAAIDHSYKIDHKWLWLDGKPRQDGKIFFLETLQSYINHLYDMEDDALLPYMAEISKSVLKYDPAHVESLSNVAVVYMISGELEKGLPYLLKAESVVPRDIVVLNNIAECYKRLKQNDKAKSYYEKMIAYGNEDEKAYAMQSIAQLK